MVTPVEAVIRRNRHQKTLSAYSTTPNTAISSSLLKQVFLQDWWLIKADSDSHGKRLGIGGFTSKENQGIRTFLSSPIVKRHDAVTLMTVDGIAIIVNGHLNRSRTLGNGFSHEICNHFVIGFPYYWEEFAALSVGEEPSHSSVSKELFGSDAYKMATPRDNGGNMLCRNIFDDILQQNNCDAFPYSGPSSAKKESSPPTKTMASTPDETLLNHKKIRAEQKRRGNSDGENVERRGLPLTRSRSSPWTRSRTRLLKK